MAGAVVVCVVFSLSCLEFEKQGFLRVWFWRRFHLQVPRASCKFRGFSGSPGGLKLAASQSGTGIWQYILLQ